MSSKFTCQAYAKWILSGEHAVIRGFPAIVCPIKGHAVTLEYQSSTGPFTLTASGIASQEIQQNFPKAIDYALSLAQAEKKLLSGKLHINNSIPAGGGLGLSAALSSSIAKWFHFINLIPTDHIFKFAKGIEDLFHGKSSGVDVAGSLNETAILYECDETPVPIVPTWSPILTLTYSGKRSHTLNCVGHVSQISSASPEKAHEIDMRMSLATDLAYRGLTAESAHEGLLLLREAIEAAANCFIDWALMTPELSQISKNLTHLGAIASKPTGSGAGGYLLSLWQSEPRELPDHSIRVRI